MNMGVSRAHLIMCAALTTIGNYYRALDNGFKALTFLEKTSDKINTAFANQLIAGCYRDMGDYSNSLRYYYRALKLAENNPYGTAMVSGLIGAVYQRNDQPDSAIFFLSKGYKILDAQTFINVELGNSYSKAGQVRLCHVFFQKSHPPGTE